MSEDFTGPIKLYLHQSGLTLDQVVEQHAEDIGNPVLARYRVEQFANGNNTPFDSRGHYRPFAELIAAKLDMPVETVFPVRFAAKGATGFANYWNELCKTLPPVDGALPDLSLSLAAINPLPEVPKAKKPAQKEPVRKKAAQKKPAIVKAKKQPKEKTEKKASSGFSIPVESRIKDPFERELTGLMPHLRAFARTLSKNAGKAEDLTQNTLEKALKARNSYKLGTNMKAWTFMILRNEFYSNQRRDWRQQLVDPVTFDHYLPGMEGAQLDHVTLKEVKERMLPQLPAEQLNALMLAVAGHTYQQMSEMLGCAEGTVKSRVSRARTELRRLMDLPPLADDVMDGLQDHDVQSSTIPDASLVVLPAKKLPVVEQPVDVTDYYPHLVTHAWRCAAARFVKRERVKRWDEVEDLIPNLISENYRGLDLAAQIKTWKQVEKADNRVSGAFCLSTLNEVCRLYNLKGQRPDNDEYYQAQDMIAALTRR